MYNMGFDKRNCQKVMHMRGKALEAQIISHEAMHIDQ